jgi:hypothetical protein
MAEHSGWLAFRQTGAGCGGFLDRARCCGRFRIFAVGATNLGFGGLADVGRSTRAHDEDPTQMTRTLLILAAAATALTAASAADARAVRHHAAKGGGSYAPPSVPIPYTQLDAYMKGSAKQRAQIVAMAANGANTGASANASATTAAPTAGADTTSGATSGTMPNDTSAGTSTGSTTGTTGAPVNPPPAGSDQTPSTATPPSSTTPPSTSPQ